MVKAELSYNPYITETTVRFNGQAPRINSQVEKYEKSTLQTWIRKLPNIFYNEMNGYDFELDFSGTEMDFGELQEAFRKAGVTDDQVKLFHKYMLDGRIKTLGQMRNLLKWLQENPNRKFDLTAFQDENVDLFHESYSYVLLQGRGLELPVFEGLPVTADIIDQVEELNDTKLKDTPILLYLTAESLPFLAKNLGYLNERLDVNTDQIFFLIHPALDTDNVTRVILDLGIAQPQMVPIAADERVRKYLEQYPITNYICESIQTLRKATSAIGEVLKQENEESAIANREIHEQLDQLDEKIYRLKNSEELFTERENLDIPSAWRSAKTDLFERINNWKNRKTNTTRDDEAYASAQELERELHMALVSYIGRITEEVDKNRDSIEKDFRTWYGMAEYDDDYVSENAPMATVAPDLNPSIWEKLMTMKSEQYVTPKEDLFSMFFKTGNEAPKEPVLEITYHYQQWREYAISVVAPIADDFQKVKFEAIENIYKSEAEQYVQHLEELIRKTTQEKEQVASQLSEDEQLLQADNDWLTTFTDQLREIERR